MTKKERWLRTREGVQSYVSLEFVFSPSIHRGSSLRGHGSFSLVFSKVVEDLSWKRGNRTGQKNGEREMTDNR